MAKLVILGSSNAVPDQNHENTHMVLIGTNKTVMIDCVGNDVVRLEQVGVDFNDLTDLILTHFHPDHVSGVPQLLMSMWLMGREKPIDIYGLYHTLDRMESLMEFYNWSKWPNFYPVAFHRLPEEELVLVLDNEEFKIHASPVKHLVPTIGLRFEIKSSQKILAYSCDTEPCEQVIRLAEGADLLLHEASGAHIGHSSAEQAGEIARKAEVESLVLIHFPTGAKEDSNLEDKAQQSFGGPVQKAEDFMTFDL